MKNLTPTQKTALHYINENFKNLSVNESILVSRIITAMSKQEYYKAIDILSQLLYECNKNCRLVENHRNS